MLNSLHLKCLRLQRMCVIRSERAHLNRVVVRCVRHTSCLRRVHEPALAQLKHHQSTCATANPRKTNADNFFSFTSGCASVNVAKRPADANNQIAHPCRASNLQAASVPRSAISSLVVSTASAFSCLNTNNPFAQHQALRNNRAQVISAC